MSNKYPIVLALPRPDFKGGLMFWCPFCQSWHLHGKGEGHRAAHCTNPESPFNETGYVLKLIPKQMRRKLVTSLKESLNE